MKVDRLVGMIMVLLEKRRMGAQALADMFEVSLRTIYRDMESISLAGIPIRSTPGVGGGFEIMQEYKVDRNVFSATDLSAILMGLSSLSTMIRGDELVNALAKVRRFVPADKAKDIELKANQIQIDLTPWIGNGNTQPFLNTIKTALQESRLLSFDYADRYGNATARTAEPYQLVLKGNHWYWLGYCHVRHDFRLFKLSRMTKLRMEDTGFVPRAYPSPQLDYTEEAVSMKTSITLRVHKSVLERVLDHCSQEDLSPDGEAHYTVNFPFRENDYHFHILLGLGDKCECIAPSHVRAEIRRRALAIAALHGS